MGVGGGADLEVCRGGVGLVARSGVGRGASGLVPTPLCQGPGNGMYNVWVSGDWSESGGVQIRGVGV